MPLSDKGQSELFTQDILSLDEQLYKLDKEALTALNKSRQAVSGGCLLVLIGLALPPFILSLSLLFIFGGGSWCF